MDIMNIKTLDQAQKALAYRILQPVATLLAGRGVRPRPARDPQTGAAVQVVRSPKGAVAFGIRKDRASENLIVELKVKVPRDHNKDGMDAALNGFRVTMNRMGYRPKPLMDRGNLYTVQMLVDPEDLMDSVVKNRARIQSAAQALASALEACCGPKAEPKAATTKRTAADVSQQEYFQDVEAAVQGIVGEIRDEYKDSPEDFDKDDALSDAQDKVHEYVDGSQWVIYTYKARHVLMYSKNEDAIFEQGDGLSNVSSMTEAYTQAAFYAMYQDVSEGLSDALDELETEMAEAAEANAAAESTDDDE